MEKSEALRLADLIRSRHGNEVNDEAAAELRRQHGEIKSMRTERLRSERRLSAVEAQRDALLEALKKAEENGGATVYANEGDEYGERGCCGVVSYMPHADDCWVTMARAAIKAVEGEKT